MREEAQYSRAPHRGLIRESSVERRHGTVEEGTTQGAKQREIVREEAQYSRAPHRGLNRERKLERRHSTVGHHTGG